MQYIPCNGIILGELQLFLSLCKPVTLFGVGVICYRFATQLFNNPALNNVGEPMVESFMRTSCMWCHMSVCLVLKVIAFIAAVLGKTGTRHDITQMVPRFIRMVGSFLIIIVFKTSFYIIVTK